MLESIRNRANGPIAKFVLALIIIPFAFAGVYSYFGVNNSDAVATVNGDDISLREFDQAYRAQQQNWGENFDRFFNTDERLQQFRMNVLQQLINQRLSSQALNEMGLRADLDQLKKSIMSTSAFHDENGNFSEDRYRIVLQSAGYTPNQYQEAQKADLAAEQFFSALSETNFTLDGELIRHQQLESQSRDIHYMTISRAMFAEGMDFSSEEGMTSVQQYYDLNQEQFRIPEKVAIDYILLSKSDFMDNEITEDQIVAYYEDNKTIYSGIERRRLAHVLVNVPVDADDKAMQAAMDKINAAKKQLDEGVAFEQVVGEFSDDTVSAEMGGDLDWIEPGMMDEAFEDAAFALMAINDVSDVVRTSFGFHLIKLLDMESGEPKPLSEVRTQIVEQLQTELAEDRFFEARDLIAEKAFEFPDSLAEASNAVDKAVQSTPLFDRQFGIGLPPELQENPAVIELAFSDQVLLDEMNSEVIDLSDQQVVVFRKSDYQAAGVRSLDEVRAQIEQTLINQQASDKAEEIASGIVKSLKDGASIDTVMMGLDESLKSLEWKQQASLMRTGTEVDSRIRDQAFEMNLQSNPIDMISLPNGDIAVLQLDAVNRPEADPLTAATHAEKFLTFYQQAELSSYIRLLDANADIERNLSNTDLVQ